MSRPTVTGWLLAAVLGLAMALGPTDSSAGKRLSSWAARMKKKAQAALGGIKRGAKKALAGAKKVVKKTAAKALRGKRSLRRFARGVKSRATKLIRTGRKAAGSLTKRVKGLVSRGKRVLGGLGRKLIDWGRKAVSYARKKVANLKVLKRLFGKFKGNPVIRWMSRTGKQIIRRLERSAKALAGNYRVSKRVPTFLQRLADWRKRRAAKGGAR